MSTFKFYGYALLAKSNKLSNVKVKSYYSIQSICQYFGYNIGTLTFKFGTLSRKSQKTGQHYGKQLELKCNKITSNLTQCDIKMARQVKKN